MIKVPEGVVVVEAEPVEGQPPQIKRFFVIEDDSELSGRDIENPEQQFDPNTNAPDRDDGVHGQGPRGIRARDEAAG